ncbi:MAG: insulinase family protein [Cellvibrionaceae bacterium]|nr:insulinase family protein [Cellvibrionaceae bacterium]
MVFTTISRYLIFCLLGGVYTIAYGAGQPAFDIARGSIDKRHYHYQVLANGLQLVLISDPTANKAAAALDVAVGSLADPQDRQGLAHFLEHMLFLGTEKYPDVDEYQAFISDHGGQHNAFTSHRHTQYFFDVDAQQLAPALDRFAQFFIAPLFDEYYVERERNAVDAEYQSSIQDDYRRSHDVYREVINPAHPEAKFAVGNMHTLADRDGDQVREDLLTFYQRHYSADNMALVVLGKEPIGELQTIVVERFRQIPQRVLAQATNAFATSAALPTSSPGEPRFLPGQLPFEVSSQPVKTLRQMTLNFPLPGIQAHYREKPLAYISHLLGHEARGSLLAVLKNLGLAESLSAGGRDHEDGSATLFISLNLTQAGMAARDKIRALVFAAIELIKHQGINPWRFEEQRALATLAFHYRETPTPLNTVRQLATNTHRYPAGDIIRAPYAFEHFDAALLKTFLAKLTPDNVYVTSVFPEAATDRVSQYYGVSYGRKSLSTQLPSIPWSWRNALSLPAANPFIPEHTHLFTPDKRLQDIHLLDSEQHRLWAKQDLSFGVPKARLFLRLQSPLVAGNLRATVLSELYSALLSDQLNTTAYSASLAGADVSLVPNNKGMDLHLAGYHDKLGDLLALVRAQMQVSEFTPARFAQLKKQLIRHWRNGQRRTPYRQLYNQLVVNLFEPYWSQTRKADELSKLSFKDLQKFAGQWREGLRIHALFYGNFDAQLLASWREDTERLALAGEQTIGPDQVVQLGGERSHFDIYPVEHSDTAVILYVQSVGDSLKDQAGMLLLRQLMQSAFYTELRTQQQLGYVVFMGSLRLRDVPGSVLVVQSPSATVDTIRQAIRTFLQDYQQQLPTNIQRYQQAVVTQLREEPSHLFASAQDHWQAVVQHRGQMDYKQRLIAAIQAYTPEQLRAYYQQVMLRPGQTLWQYSRQFAQTASLSPALPAQQAPPQMPQQQAFVRERFYFYPW